jgi:hypothetical protein
MLKYLRIAVTALSLTVCVLLVALWVRSYWWFDSVDSAGSETEYVRFISSSGQLSVDKLHNNRRRYWKVESRTAEEAAAITQGAIPQIQQIQQLTGRTMSPPPTFLFRWTDERLSIRAPHWLPVLLTAVSAAALGIRRPYRFSLRTLLIATTLVAVGMGIIVAAR